MPSSEEAMQDKMPSFAKGFSREPSTETLREILSQALYQLFSVIRPRGSALLLFNNSASDEPVRGRHGRIDCAHNTAASLIDDEDNIFQQTVVVSNGNSLYRTRQSVFLCFPAHKR